MSQYDGHSSGGTAGRGDPDDSNDGSEAAATEAIPGTTPGTSTDDTSSSATSESTSSGQSLGLTLGIGATLGMVAFALNYALVFLFTRVDGVDFSEENAPDVTFKLVGQILYNAQFVPVKGTWGSPEEGASQIIVDFNYVRGTSTLASAPESATETVGTGEFVTAIGSTVPVPVYHATPVVVLFLAGLVLVSVVDGTPTVLAGAVVGGFITLGTLVAAAAGTMLFTISYGELFSLTLTPRLVAGIGLAGLAIPLVAGALGGVVGSLLKRALA